jgi:acyl-CoA thioester hydrolase
MSAFSWPARVYWEDTDGGGIVYYANYLRYLERARTEWLRALGFSQSRLAQEQGVIFTVVGVNIEYRRPARLDDELRVTCEPRIQGATVHFRQQVLRQDEALAEADVRAVCVDAQTLRPRRLPPFLLNALAQR